MNDELVFAEDEQDCTPETVGSSSVEPWKLMIIDDDEDIHQLTKLVFRNFKFESRPLKIVSGYSGQDASRLMIENPDTAVLLLDVVMESDVAGLEAVQTIRDELKNSFVRIILRTGQPGQAPEVDVITGYDINDYKEKTDLTEQKLITSVTASLRSYRDLRTIEQNRIGLEKVLLATKMLFQPRSLNKLAAGILEQLATILKMADTAFYVHPSTLSGACEETDYVLFAGTGCFADKIGRPFSDALSPETQKMIFDGKEKQENFFIKNSFIGYFKSSGETKNILYVKGDRNLDYLDRQLIEIFSSNVSLAFDNVSLNQEIQDTQRDITFTLGELIEAKSHQSGNHVRRVAAGARLIAEQLELPEEETMLLWLASPLHDLGKIGIPDQVLNKPGVLDAEEWALMQDHAKIGFQILKKSNRKLLQVAATIAIQHHERWDGKGYPTGLKGEEIDLFARIIALLDVFDALSNNRCYKKAWEKDRVLHFIKEGREKRFDPKLVDILLENLDDFYQIQEDHADS
ncbi:MAG: DUF3369 domain-containing protein [Magnetococcales bacterium]|nr:DUF3369 domain-containing protein [Magnetococcales bacterium]